MSGGSSISPTSRQSFLGSSMSRFDLDRPHRPRLWRVAIEPGTSGYYDHDYRLTRAEMWRSALLVLGGTFLLLR